MVKANWHELLQCTVCGCYWRIDAADKYQDRFAWKIGTFREDWATVEFPEKEKALLLQRRGGDTVEKCMWLGCEKRKVKGVAFCIDHLYATGALAPMASSSGVPFPVTPPRRSEANVGEKFEFPESGK